MKANQMGVQLRGQRNQCGSCDALFNSVGAFEKHRVGTHGIDRRCLDVDAMKAAGMVLGADGFWRGSAMPEDLAAGFAS